jgi:hypothetical protein
MASATPTQARKSLGARIVYVVLICLAFSGAAGGCEECSCESCMAEGAYNDKVNEAMRDFEYEVPPADAWREMLAVLKEHGYELLQATPRENTTLSTPLVGDQGYDVRLQRVSSTRYTLTLGHVEMLAVDGGTRRTVSPDPGIEWELVQRLEPTRAEKIRAAADASAERSAALGRGCDRGCAFVLRHCSVAGDRRP